MAIHSVIREESRCVGCVTCMKRCPTKAIRVRASSDVPPPRPGWGAVVRINQDLCIDCGSCIRACEHGAVRAHTSSPSDLKRFRYNVAIPSTTIYTQFGSDYAPAEVAAALLATGFDAFYDVSWMCEMVSHAVDAYLSECGRPWPKVSVTCPAIIRLILHRYPALVPHLIPVHTPRELAAKLARRKFAAAFGARREDIGVFHVTPCSAMMQSIVAPLGLHDSNFDGAFSIAEMYGPMLRILKAGVRPLSDEHFLGGGLAWAAAGGETGAMRDKNSLSVTGVDDVVSVFDGIEAGKFRNLDFIEAYICPDGCISGQLLIEERYAARRTLQRIHARLKCESTVAEEKVRSMFREHFFDMDEEIKAPAIRPMSETLAQAIRRRQEKHRLLEQLPRKNCAACGAPDCETLAEDIIAGDATLEDCVFVRLGKLEERR